MHAREAEQESLEHHTKGYSLPSTFLKRNLASLIAKIFVSRSLRSRLHRIVQLLNL
jgi:hypothetical protein